MKSPGNDPHQSADSDITPTPKRKKLVPDEDLGVNPMELSEQLTLDSVTNTSELSEYMSCELESSSDIEVFR